MLDCMKLLLKLVDHPWDHMIFHFDVGGCAGCKTLKISKIHVTGS